MFSNFSLVAISILRYASRSLVIPFKLPSVGPITEAETKEFRDLSTAKKKASSAVGWVIRVGKDLEQGC